MRGRPRSAAGWLRRPNGSQFPESGSVPDGFTPEKVIRCSAAGTPLVEDKAGRWSTVREEHLSGDLEPLLQALSVPSERGGNMACPAVMEVLPELWLVDAAGRAMRPAWPTTACGQSKPGVAVALSGLAVEEAVTHKVRLIEPRAAVDSMRVCLHRLDKFPDHEPIPGGDGGLSGQTMFISATFVSAHRLGEKEAHRLLKVAGSKPDADQCETVAPSFAVVWPLEDGQKSGAPITVELEGCHRLIPDDGDARNVPPDLLATVSNI